MKIVDASFKIVEMPGPEALRQIEEAGRTCYKSEDMITPDSAEAFVKRILEAGHHSVIEHVSATIRFICDRGVTHEIVRHRLAAYSQESTRYCNYSKGKHGNESTVIRPLLWSEDSKEYSIWLRSMQDAENVYMDLIKAGASPQEARSVLPNSLKTEIVMTCNLREWRHVFSLRCSQAAHPQMREIMLPLLAEFRKRIPVLFDDLYARFLDV